MNSHIDLNHPEDIYDDLKLKISDLISKIVKSEDLLDTQLVGEKFNESKQILSFQQKDIERQIDELKCNAEWDYFTIAFFGETNAGKSTLIEVLRILFAEQTKRELQAKFNQLKNEFSLDEKEYEQLKGAETEIDQKILENKQILKDIDQTYAQGVADYQSILNGLNIENEEKIAHKSVEHNSKLEQFNIQIEALKKRLNIKNKLCHGG